MSLQEEDKMATVKIGTEVYKDVRSIDLTHRRNGVIEVTLSPLERCYYDPDKATVVRLQVPSYLRVDVKGDVDRVLNSKYISVNGNIGKLTNCAKVRSKGSIEKITVSKNFETQIKVIDAHRMDAVLQRERNSRRKGYRATVVHVDGNLVDIMSGGDIFSDSPSIEIDIKGNVNEMKCVDTINVKGNIREAEFPLKCLLSRNPSKVGL